MSSVPGIANKQRRILVLPLQQPCGADPIERSAFSHHYITTSVSSSRYEPLLFSPAFTSCLKDSMLGACSCERTNVVFVIGSSLTRRAFVSCMIILLHIGECLLVVAWANVSGRLAGIAYVVVSRHHDRSETYVSEEVPSIHVCSHIACPTKYYYTDFDASRRYTPSELPVLEVF